MRVSLGKLKDKVESDLIIKDKLDLKSGLIFRDGESMILTLFASKTKNKLFVSLYLCQLINFILKFQPILK